MEELLDPSHWTSSASDSPMELLTGDFWFSSDDDDNNVMITDHVQENEGIEDIEDGWNEPVDGLNMDSWDFNLANVPFDHTYSYPGSSAVQDNASVSPTPSELMFLQEGENEDFMMVPPNGGNASIVHRLTHAASPTEIARSQNGQITQHPFTPFSNFDGASNSSPAASARLLSYSSTPESLFELDRAARTEQLPEQGTADQLGSRQTTTESVENSGGYNLRTRNIGVITSRVAGTPPRNATENTHRSDTASLASRMYQQLLRSMDHFPTRSSASSNTAQHNGTSVTDDAETLSPSSRSRIIPKLVETMSKVGIDTGSARSSRAMTPENCSICLEKVLDGASASLTYPCLHTFCYQCICEWVEKTKNSCPNCQAVVTKVIYNLRSEHDYDIKNVESTNRLVTAPPFDGDFFEIFFHLHQRRGERNRSNAMNSASTRSVPLIPVSEPYQVSRLFIGRFSQIPSAAEQELLLVGELVVSRIAFRRRVYAEHLTGRLDSQATFTSPLEISRRVVELHGFTERFEPWLRREIVAVSYPHTLDSTCEEIFQAVTDFMRSRRLHADAFKQLLQIHVPSVRHDAFWEQLCQFVESRYNMGVWDVKMRYFDRQGQPIQSGGQPAATSSRNSWRSISHSLRAPTSHAVTFDVITLDSDSSSEDEAVEPASAPERSDSPTVIILDSDSEEDVIVRHTGSAISVRSGTSAHLGRELFESSSSSSEPLSPEINERCPASQTLDPRSVRASSASPGSESRSTSARSIIRTSQREPVSASSAPSSSQLPLQRPNLARRRAWQARYVDTYRRPHSSHRESHSCRYRSPTPTPTYRSRFLNSVNRSRRESIPRRQVDRPLSRSFRRELFPGSLERRYEEPISSHRSSAVAGSSQARSHRRVLDSPSPDRLNRIRRIFGHRSHIRRGPDVNRRGGSSRSDAGESSSFRNGRVRRHTQEPTQGTDARRTRIAQLV